MIDNTDHDDAAGPAALLRLMTIVIGSVQIIAFVLFAHLMLQSTDPLGESIGEAMALLMAAPILAFTLPALILAWMDRAPRTAFGLALLAIPVAAAAWWAA
jgi:hypothetical protein